MPTELCYCSNFNRNNILAFGLGVKPQCFFGIDQIVSIATNTKNCAEAPDACSDSHLFLIRYFLLYYVSARVLVIFLK